MRSLSIKNFGISILVVIIFFSVTAMRLGIGCIVDAVKDDRVSMKRFVAKTVLGIAACVPAIWVAARLIIGFLKV